MSLHVNLSNVDSSYKVQKCTLFLPLVIRGVRISNANSIILMSCVIKIKINSN